MIQKFWLNWFCRQQDRWPVCRSPTRLRSFLREGFAKLFYAIVLCGIFKHLPGRRREGLTPSFNSFRPVTTTFCVLVFLLLHEEESQWPWRGTGRRELLDECWIQTTSRSVPRKEDSGSSKPTPHHPKAFKIRKGGGGERGTGFQGCTLLSISTFIVWGSVLSYSPWEIRI